MTRMSETAFSIRQLQPHLLHSSKDVITQSTGNKNPERVLNS